jgi:hypothetical protein
LHRDRLAEGWSPDRSEAAAAFISRINEMIDSMTAAAGAAGRISTGVDEAFAAIREARRVMEPMLAAYGKRPAGAGLVTSNAQNDRLDQQAREVMIAADVRVTAASSLINTDVPDSTRYTEAGAPVIHGPVGGSGSTTSGASVGRAPEGSISAGLQAPVFDPPPPSGSPEVDPIDSSIDTSGGATGPTLTGTSADPPSSPGAGQWFGQPVTGPSGLIGGGSGRGDAVQGPFGGAPASAVLPPGGVIGATRPSSGPSGPFAVPPTGGMAKTGSTSAAHRRAATRRAGEPESFGLRGTSGTAAGGYRDRSFEEYAERRRTRRANADEQWPVEEGVPPLLEAPKEPTHDPGPGVLGIDR